MYNIVFNRLTRQVCGYDRQPMPFELELLIPYPISLSKTVEEITGMVIQKVNENGELLYLNGEVETTEARVATEFETVINTYRIATDEVTLETVVDELGVTTEVEVPIYEEISTSVEMPISFDEHEPIMIDEVVSKTYTFDQNPYIFVVDEVIEAIAATVPVKTEFELAVDRVSATEDAIMTLMDMNLL